MDPELEAYAGRHLAPVGLTVAEGAADAGRTAHPDRRYRTTGAVDAFYRVRAAVTGQAAQTTHYAPCLPPTSPIAVVSGEQPASFHLTTAAEDLDLDDHDLLPALADLGATTARATHQTLVVDTPRTLNALTSLARTGHTPVSLAAALDWWGQRADHPGTGATRVLSRDLTLRWTLATLPSARVTLTDWQAALAPACDPSEAPGRVALLLAEHLAAGSTLPGLLNCHNEDSRSWTWLLRTAGPRWRAHDTRREAALGLLTRGHAAELYASLRLGDPVLADAQTRTGTIVETAIVALDDQTHTVRLHADRPLIRHRVGTRVQAWLGTATTPQPDAPDLVGTLTDVVVTPTGTLHLTLGEVVKPSRLTVGADLTVRPRQTDPFQQGTFRSMYHQHFGSSRNWLARTAAPTVTRRSVPLDVIVAAADD